jgi:hypothetical protein
MPSQTDKTAGELDWVGFAERTPSAECERTHKFDVPTGRAIDELEQELERV